MPCFAPFTPPAGKAGHDPFRDALYLLPSHIKVILIRKGYGRLEYNVPRTTTFEELQDRVDADLGETFERYDLGYPGNRFGPGKRLDQIFRPDTFQASQAWE